jgi:NAD(P)-dependent dehydrogenase (short-subunit alcohol dehydrogenase family)
VHNAGHMVMGPAEAFTPEEIAHIYDVNVLGAHRVNRAVLPHLRGRGSGLLVWIGSSSTRGGHTPFIGPYFAAKAALDSLAVDYADELIRFGIETCIVVPGAFTSGTRHFDDAGHPADAERAAEYKDRYGRFMEDIRPRLAALAPPGADVREVAQRIAEIVDLPAGQRPFRVHVDPNRNGSEVVAAVADRIRADFYRRLGIDDLLPVHSSL